MLAKRRSAALIMAVFVMLFTFASCGSDKDGDGDQAQDAEQNEQTVIVEPEGTVSGPVGEIPAPQASAAGIEPFSYQGMRISKGSYMSFIGRHSSLAELGGVKTFNSSNFDSKVLNVIKKSLTEGNSMIIPTPPANAAPSWPDPSKPMIALTFDDGPYSPVTDRILTMLETYGGHATFFVVGDRVGSYTASVERAIRDGCQIANHTYDHGASLAKLTFEEVQMKLHDADICTAYYAGVATVLARPVGGAVSDIAIAASDKPYINWSVDTLDWKSRNAASVQSKILNNAKDGDIILMHDLYDSTAAACEAAIPELINRGFQLVTVSEMAAAKGYALEDGQVYMQFWPQ